MIKMSAKRSAKFLFLVSCLALLFACDKGASSGSEEETADTSASLADCGAEPIFTALPAAIEDVRGLVPLGNLNPPGHVFPTDHIYFYSKDSAQIDLYSPGDITITKVTATQYLSEELQRTDYDVTFQPCKQFKGYFYHIDTLAQSILGQITFSESNCSTYTTGGQTFKKCTEDVSIVVKAGEKIGTADIFDLGAYDSRITPLAYANASRITSSSDGFDGLHVVCPIDYFATSVKGELEAKFGSYDGARIRTASPVCGEVEQDEAGTAQGRWYYTGASGEVTEDPHLALVHDNIDPTVGVFSSGTSISNMYSSTFYFTPASSGMVNLDFNKVTGDGNIYCYDNLAEYVGGEPIAAVILVQMPTSTTLKIERQEAASCGAGPWSFNSPTSFER